MRVLKIPALKPSVFAVCLFPLGWLLWNGVTGGLGANPIEATVRRTGFWTLTFLLITLAVTPARRLPGASGLTRLRRMLGLFAFFYACLHAVSYVGVDQFFAIKEIAKDIAKRPFITVGFVSFVLLVPLAVTSTDAMIRRLGGRRWRRVHRLVYLIAVGGVVHYFWLVKADVRQPVIYGGLVAVLLGVRLWSTYSRYLTSRGRSVAVDPGREALQTTRP